jgi:hypothetical protein
MENLTSQQQKHKDKIELLSRLIDEKAINLTEALLLLSNTEEVVEQSKPSIQYPPGVRSPFTPPSTSPFYYTTAPNTSPYVSVNGNGIGSVTYTDTTGVVSTLSQRINGGDLSGKMTTDEILQDYLQKVDSQE